MVTRNRYQKSFRGKVLPFQAGRNPSELGTWENQAILNACKQLIQDLSAEAFDLLFKLCHCRLLLLVKFGLNFLALGDRFRLGSSHLLIGKLLSLGLCLGNGCLILATTLG